MTDASGEDALAFAFAATLGTGMVLGLNRMALNIIALAADQLGVSHEGSS